MSGHLNYELDTCLRQALGAGSDSLFIKGKLTEQWMKLWSLDPPENIQTSVRVSTLLDTPTFWVHHANFPFKEDDECGE